MTARTRHGAGSRPAAPRIPALAPGAGDPFAELAVGPHRRYDPLLDEWLLVSPERTRRPWRGRTEVPAVPPVLGYDPACYLCPGNRRAGGRTNPDYEETFVFTNDYAALEPDVPDRRLARGLLRAETEAGTCRVLCFSPRHDLSLVGMGRTGIRTVIDLWADQTAELGERFRWVQVFENRGASMGASNPHPHGQIWASTAVPHLAEREDRTQLAHFGDKGRPLLLDYMAQETGGPRTVIEAEAWLVVVPFWATWPFETLLIPRQPAERLPALDDARRDTLAIVLLDLLAAYDRLFGLPFPYSMGWHQAPFRGRSEAHWQLHAHFFPPLLTATLRKHMVGYEMLAEPQRDVTAEYAAERLRDAVDGVLRAGSRLGPELGPRP